ncbi:MAG: zinc ribbon domain-containing protein [Ruminococcus sp.]|nr:zinc ribbon domain-containing protein [Ruminococcus sp.]
MKCSECGAKIRKDESTCPECGYEHYREIFSDIASELDKELSAVTEAELLSVAKESKGMHQKLTLEEFETEYLRNNNIRKPLNTVSNILKTAIYESNLKKAYKDYLERIGYGI